MIRINEQLSIGEDELELHAIRAQGSGGQNVNKVSTAIHLRFDIPASTLPQAVKDRLLSSRDRRISDTGVLVIKAQSHRSQDKNRRDALDRLIDVINQAAKTPRKRIPTRPGRAAHRRRLEGKKKRADTKKSRAWKHQD